MNKKDIANLFFNSFNTDIKKIITTGNLEGSGHPAQNSGEVVFGNYADYTKREFTRDFNTFAKNIGRMCGVDVKSLKKTGNSYKSFYYKWDPEQTICINGIKFIMGRRMMNMAHAILDGTSQCFYIDISDVELVEEIKLLEENNKLCKEQKRLEELPRKKQQTIEKCKEIVDCLNKYINGEKDLDEESISRINIGHFQICEMII